LPVLSLFLPRILATACCVLIDCEVNWLSFQCRCFRCPIVDTNEYLIFHNFVYCGS
jgi:hypothetical protein